MTVSGMLLKRGKNVTCYEVIGPGKYKEMNITDRIFDGPDCYRWREVFAWWPVKTVGGKYVWLRKVYKQRCWVVWGNGFHMEPHIEYGDLFDILSN